jgi:hypothetical protein
MDSLAHVLQSGIAQDLRLAGPRVDLDIDDMETEARASATGSATS